MNATPRRATKAIVAGFAVLVAVGLGVTSGSWLGVGTPGATASSGASDDLTKTTPPTLTAAPSATPTGPTTITVDLADATIGRYGTRTKVAFVVVAQGPKLRYVWQRQAASGGAWKAIKGATASHYTARAKTWSNGTRFRVVV